MGCPIISSAATHSARAVPYSGKPPGIAVHSASAPSKKSRIARTWGGALPGAGELLATLQPSEARPDLRNSFSARGVSLTCGPSSCTSACRKDASFAVGTVDPSTIVRTNSFCLVARI
eukprot:6491071-Prymnesium_polylepis.1